MKRTILIILCATMIAAGYSIRSYAGCECEVGTLSGDTSECSLLWMMARQKYSGYPSGQCAKITFAPGLAGTIYLNSGFPIHENVTLVGNTFSDGTPKISLKASASVSTDHLVGIYGQRTSTEATVRNIGIEAGGKSAIYLTPGASGHSFENVRVANSDIGIRSKASGVTFKGIVAYGNRLGILVEDAAADLITRSLFYQNSEKAIELNNGNNDIPYPEQVAAVVKQDGSAVVGAVGLSGPTVTSFELFEQDPATLSQSQGQGKVFKEAKTPNIFPWDVNGMRRFSFQTSSMLIGKNYTLTAFDAENDTSEFSPKFGSSDPGRVTGDVPCLTEIWFMRALDGKDKDGNTAKYYDPNGNAVLTFSGDPWSVDSDGDGYSNLREDKNQNCVVDSGETDPEVPDYHFNFGGYPKYRIPPLTIPCIDVDMDGVACGDNCPTKYNPDQKDSDKNGIGDACEGDRDDDGIPDKQDNCPDVPNTDQRNTDGDLLGDVCDPDRDNDGLTNDEEKEAGTNELIPDSDGDGYCDGTGWGYKGRECEPMDNCPLVYNPDQRDSDNDGIGDKCDMEPNNPCSMLDSDDDGIVDYKDNCPRVANAAQADYDGDGTGDPCDFFHDTSDRQYAAEFGEYKDQFHKDDRDGDGLPDKQDTDMDGDGILNGKDNCPRDWNKDQRDSDSDGIGDLCDNYDDLNFLPYATESHNYTVKWWVKYTSMLSERLMNHEECDADDDGIPNGNDNCPGVTAKDEKACLDGKGPSFNAPSGADVCWNYDQTDGDKDGVGDICDNCPGTKNFDQKDTDGDGIGDACDNCPRVANKDQDPSACAVTPEPDTGTGILNPPAGGFAEIEGGGSYTSSVSGCNANLSGVEPASLGLPVAMMLIGLPLALFALRRKIRF